MQEPQADGNQDAEQPKLGGSLSYAENWENLQGILAGISAKLEKSQHGRAGKPTASAKRDTGDDGRSDAQAEAEQIQELETEGNRNVEHFEAGSDMISSEDAERVNEMFGRISGIHLSDVDALNGFLTALVCSPRLVHFDKILGIAVSRRDENMEANRYDSIYRDLDEAKWFMEFLRGHLVDLHYVLNDTKRRYKPCIRCETKQGCSWATGFIMVMGYLFDDWKEIYFSKSHGEELAVILALACEDKVKPDHRQMVTEKIDAMRPGILSLLPDAVHSIHAFFEEGRKADGDTYPMFFSRYNITVINPADDSDPETRRIKEKYGLDNFGGNRDASEEADGAKSENGTGKPKNKRK